MQTLELKISLYVTCGKKRQAAKREGESERETGRLKKNLSLGIITVHSLYYNNCQYHFCSEPGDGTLLQ